MANKKDILEIEGTVIETLPNAQFRIEMDDGGVVLGHTSGKMRMYKIKILPGDRVRLEVNKHDTTRGRITYRLK